VSVNDKLNKLLGTRLEEATKVKSDSAFEVVLQMVGAYMGEEAAMSKIYCRLSYNKGVENWEQYAVAASDYIDKQGFNNTDYVNTLSWDLYEHCNNQSVLKKSVDWMKRVSDQEPTYAYLDTYASLLYKTGSKKKAKATAQKAIAVGNENKIDVKETELLLEKIKASK
jgi:hypothetical protein